MQQSIDSILALEIKQQIAERYFGFRKLIEEDIRDYDNKILTFSVRLEQKIGFDMVRLYVLLKDENLIREFFEVIGLNQLFFFDPYLTESPTIRKRVFAGIKVHGLTKGGRFKNLVLDTYDSLAGHVMEYRENRRKVAADWANISAEIDLFYKQNDLGIIMGFLRSLDGDGAFRSGSMEGGLTEQLGTKLEKKMLVQPPLPVDQLLPDIPEIVALRHIKGAVKKIINRAYLLQYKFDWREIVRS